MKSTFSGIAVVKRLKAKLRQSLLMLAVGLLISAAVATSAQSTNDVPPLRPALPEIPPTLWEQYGLLLSALGMVVLALVGAGIWWLLQPKPPIPVPIETLTRQELAALGQRAEDGPTLSAISRCMRRYFAIGFDLPPGEFTTTEFCRAISTSERIGSALATAVGDFLRRTDEMKFAPGRSPSQTGAAAQARELFEAGEARRAALRQTVKPA